MTTTGLLSATSAAEKARPSTIGIRSVVKYPADATLTSASVRSTRPARPVSMLNT